MTSQLIPLGSVAPARSGVLIDSFGRRADDLRISLTDKCSLRCTYCMPAEGLNWLPKDQVLSDDEIVRLAEVFVGLGVTSIRLTGGEPLVRPTGPDQGERRPDAC
jgi:cyclic pyranopterin phosphate synthase